MTGTALAALIIATIGTLGAAGAVVYVVHFTQRVYGDMRGSADKSASLLQEKLDVQLKLSLTEKDRDTLTAALQSKDAEVAGERAARKRAEQYAHDILERLDKLKTPESVAGAINAELDLLRRLSQETADRR